MLGGIRETDVRNCVPNFQSTRCECGGGGSSHAGLDGTDGSSTAHVQPRGVPLEERGSAAF